MSRWLGYGAEPEEPFTSDLLVQYLCLQVNHTGSDV
jgi:hypothetical protein